MENRPAIGQVEEVGVEVTRDQGRRSGSAAAWIEDHGGAVRVVAAELAEYSGRINALLAYALEAVTENPDSAQSRLVDIAVLLENHVHLEVADILAFVRTGIDKLAEELTDEDEATP